MRHQGDLLDDLLTQVSSCNVKKAERNAMVDELVIVVEDAREKNKKLDGFVEFCQEDKMNISRTFIL